MFIKNIFRARGMLTSFAVAAVFASPLELGLVIVLKG
jgi:hypothetical protein